jgi:hypothetical protein
MHGTRKIKVALMALLTAFTGLVVVAPAPAQAAPPWLYILNEKSGKVLQGRTTAKGVGVLQKTYIGSQPQQWLLVDVDGDNIWDEGDIVGFRNAGTSSQYGLAISGGRIDNGAPAILWDYHMNNAEQQWVLHYVLRNTVPPLVTLKNVGSGRCLAIGSGSTADNAAAIQWNCNGGLEQMWNIPFS